MCISVDLERAAEYAEEINVYNDGAVSVYGSDDEYFDEIICSWKDLIDGAHEMPAFGVSLNAETVKALKCGIWIEFVFNSVYESGGMPYEKLLVKVIKSYQGFNVIRYNEDKGYDGRCFYYDLNGKDMSVLYDVLVK